MDIEKILQQLDLEDATGHYEKKFYVIPIPDSNEYAKMYTKLETNAINTEYPNFGTNTNNTTIKVTNYFELDTDDTTYNLFLMADFENDKYYLKIGEAV